MPLINEKFPLNDKIHYSNQKLGKEWGIQIVGMLFPIRFGEKNVTKALKM